MVLVGCSSKQFAVNSFGPDKESSEVIFENVLRNNISEEGFYIEKASLNFKMNDETKKYLFSLKFNKPKTYLISIKNLTGIEGARILITGDTILINDRIGKRLFYGDPEVIEEKTGIYAGMLGIIFGDLILGEAKNKVISENSSSKLNIIQTFDKKIFKSTIDREIGKIVSVSILSPFLIGDIERDSVYISFSKFSKGEKVIPTNIEIKDLRRNIAGKIRIEKFEIPWSGEMGFIAGKGYKREKIR
jgi:hypothetical protein